MADSDSVIISLLLCGTAWFVFQYLHQRITKSDLDIIPGPSSSSFWSGNLQKFYDRHSFDFHEEVAYDYGSVVKLVGPFARRMLYVYDPRALHSIFLKDQNCYEEGSTFANSHRLVIGPGLTGTMGEQHRRQRKILNPAFSVNHMRSILPVFRETVERLRIALTSQLSAGPREIDLIHWMGRTSLELIGQGGLGYSFDPLTEAKQNDYGDAVRAIFPAMQDLFIFRPLIPYFFKMGPTWFRRYLVDLLPFVSVKRLKTLSDTMARESTKIFEDKKAALHEEDGSLLNQVGKGRDIMTLLMKANNEADENDRLPDDEILGQMSIMTLAATDTSTTSTARACLLLAQHPDIQGKLRDEIQQAGGCDQMTYDELNKLPLLDAIVRETLRVYPSVNLQTREVIKDTVIPLSQPVRTVDGRLLQEVPVQAGTEIFIGVLGCNTSKALWGDDAREWKPERWLKPLPKTLTDAPIPGVYTHLMTFLGGKKSCIGFKFAELAIKVSLSMLISNFTLELTEKPIIWNMATVTYPTVNKNSLSSELPLKMKLVEV